MNPILVALVLLSCGSVDPTVRGGTASQREVVLAVVDEMRSTSSFFPKISSISIREFGGGEGRYSTVGRGIVLDDNVTLEELEANAWHELCHAVDLQLPFHSERIESFGDSSRVRREAFAELCGAGPAGISSIINCGGDTSERTALRIQAEVFDLAEQPASIPAWAPAGSLELEAGTQVRRVEATHDGYLVIFTTNGIELVDFSGLPAPDTIDGIIPPYEEVDRTAYERWRFTDASVVIGDQEAGIGTWRFRVEEQAVQVMVFEFGKPVLTMCATSNDTIFPHDGEFWIARQDGTSVAWAPLR